MQVIIYNQDNGIPAVMTPAPECLQTHTILEIAIKDVPAGTPYWIVDVSDIPSDRTFRESWEIDDSIEPTGVTP